MNIETSTDGVAYAPLAGGPTNFAIGPVAGAVAAEQFAFAPVTASFFRFNVTSNYGGGGASFSEVMFDGTVATATPKIDARSMVTPLTIVVLMMAMVTYRPRRREVALSQLQ